MTGEIDLVQILVDKDAIWECSLRYTRGLDRLDIDLFRSAYWDDAHTCHGRVNGSVDEFLEWWLGLQSGRETGHHMMMNQRVQHDGPDAADVETYFLASIKNYGDDRVELLAGRYIDRFEKREKEWRIKTRILLFEWQATADASEMAARFEGMHSGTRDEADASYERPVSPRLASPVLTASARQDADPRVEATGASAVPRQLARPSQRENR